MAKVYSVEQINSYIKNMFDTDFVLNRVSVGGEVSNCKYHGSGHIYFTVKDGQSALAAVMFAGNRNGLNFKLEDGMQIVVTGSISVYERDGRYQIYARKIERAGDGELYARFIALKEELESMGMFDPMYKRPVPAYVRKLGVVTADTGAAIQDIINIAKRRNPYIQIVFCPAQVQGVGAAESICRGIFRLDRYGVDVIIAGRGGGSMEDLWAFNERSVAQAIFECETPVISAVGHETDYTIADFAADLRAPTPSAAAELAVCDIGDVIRRISEYENRLYMLINSRLDVCRDRIAAYFAALSHLSPMNILDSKRRRLMSFGADLDRLVNALLENRRNELSLKCARLNALSPLARMSTGYSYVTNESGTAVTSVDSVQNGDVLNINVKDGVIRSKVTEVARR